MSLADWHGTWKFVTLEIDGRPIPESVFSSSKLVVIGDRVTTYSSEATYEATVEIDPDSTPKTFDLIFTGGPEKGNKSFGIYELDGDTLKLCLTTVGTVRPREFATQPGTGHAFETQQREYA